MVSRRRHHTAKITLTPCLVDHDRDRVGKIEATGAATHGKADLRLIGKAIVNFGRQAGRLGAEQEGIARGVARRVIALRGEFRHPEQAIRPQCRQTGIETVMLSDAGKVMIIKSGTTTGLGVKRETKWLNQVQTCPGVGAKPDDVAGIRWNLGVEEDDVKHRLVPVRPVQTSAEFTASGAAVRKAGSSMQAVSIATRRGMSSRSTPQRLAL